MIYTFGSAPYNQGRPVVNYGALSPTGYKTYNEKSMTVAQVSGVIESLNRYQNSHFYVTTAGTYEVFSSHDNGGQIDELLISNVGSATARIYINEEEDFVIDQVVMGPNGGFDLASGQSIQLRHPITHIGQIGTADILFHGSVKYNYNTI